MAEDDRRLGSARVAQHSVDADDEVEALLRGALARALQHIGRLAALMRSAIELGVTSLEESAPHLFSEPTPAALRVLTNVELSLKHRCRESILVAALFSVT